MQALDINELYIYLYSPNLAHAIYLFIFVSSLFSFQAWLLSLFLAQFTSLLISHNLLGFVDGSIKPPSPFIYDYFGNQQPNPNYRSWLRVDQIVRSWSFATLSREVLVDVHLLPRLRIFGYL